MQTVNPKVNLLPASDIMAALQTILRSQATVPNLETPYSQVASPNPNHCAIELKDQSLNAIITERQQQLDTVLHEISDLQTVMDSIQNLHQQLVEKKDNIVESINLHKRLGSAMWRFPTEVLSHIFVYCLPEDKYLLPTLNLAPMLLTRICRRWREVAVGIPSLWYRLRLEVEDGDWQKRVFCYESWLKRTIERPLSLALQCDDNDWTRVQKLVQPHIAQISSLSIEFLERDPPDLTVFTGSLALKELSVIISDELAGGAMLASIGRFISQLPILISYIYKSAPLKMQDCDHTCADPERAKVVLATGILVNVGVLLESCRGVSNVPVPCIRLRTVTRVAQFSNTLAVLIRFRLSLSKRL